MSQLRIVPIRHHGAGSARSLLRVFEEFDPDCILVEALPDFEPLLPFLNDPETIPPINKMAYVSDDLSRVLQAPMAVFSPEYQAIRWGLKRDLNIRCIDIPAEILFAVQGLEAYQHDYPALLEEWVQQAGYESMPEFWDTVIEDRVSEHPALVFDRIIELFTAVRDGVENPPLNTIREYHMQQHLYAAQTEGFERIAVVVGAYHSPIFNQAPIPEPELPEDLDYPEVRVTLTPWTYSRLHASVNASGVVSPAWNEHIFAGGTLELWLLKAATLLRQHKFEAATAQIIDATQHAEISAHIEGRSTGLVDLVEALQTMVITSAYTTALDIISKELIIGEKFGTVPIDKIPTVPLLQDLYNEIERLDLTLDERGSIYTLDIRGQLDLERSHFFYRMRLLQIPFATSRSKSNQGTYRETWEIAPWTPQLQIALIENAVYGPTIATAAIAKIESMIEEGLNFVSLVKFLHEALNSNLPDLVLTILDEMQKFQDFKSLDLDALFTVLYEVSVLLTYTSLRQVEKSLLNQIFFKIFARLQTQGVDLLLAAKEAVESSLVRFHYQLDTMPALYNPQKDLWWLVLEVLAADHRIGYYVGKALHLRLEGAKISHKDFTERVEDVLLLEDAVDISHFLKGLFNSSGRLLIHNPPLFDAILDWLEGLDEEIFIETLPLLRRAFNDFEKAEKRRLRQMAGDAKPEEKIEEGDLFDEEFEDIFLDFLGGTNDEE